LVGLLVHHRFSVSDISETANEALLTLKLI